MNTTFYTKIELAQMILLQFCYPEEICTKVANKIARMDESDFKEQCLKAGFNYKNLGYNRYQII
jgi:hypothetical protein